MMTTSCAMMLEKISAYLDGELAAPACSAIERHCETCDACRRLVEGLRDTMGLCRKAGRAPVPASVRDVARRHVRELLAAERRPPSMKGRTRSRAGRSR